MANEYDNLRPDLNVLGGKTSLTDPTTSGVKGVYARHPAAQLKHYTSETNNNALKTQARLYLSIPDAFKPKGINPVVDHLVQQLTGEGYINFLLQSVQEQFSEKVQVTEFLSDDFVAYYFGGRPSVFSFSGTLFNTVQDDWWDSFYFAVQELLRGTMVARRSGLVHLRYGTKIVSGALNDFSVSHSADMQMTAQMSFSMLVKHISIVPSPKHRTVYSSSALTAKDLDPAGSSAGKFNLAAFGQQLKLKNTVQVTANIIEASRPPAATTSTTPVDDLEKDNKTVAVDSKKPIENAPAPSAGYSFLDEVALGYTPNTA